MSLTLQYRLRTIKIYMDLNIAPAKPVIHIQHSMSQLDWTTVVIMQAVH